jgi:hypothetical protein
MLSLSDGPVGINLCLENIYSQGQLITCVGLNLIWKWEAES